MLTGQCVELGAEGLRLRRSWMRSHAGPDVRPDALADVLGPAAEGLARLLPELAAGTTVRPAAVELQKAQLLEHVLGALGRLGEERPVLLAIEDLHWADQSTLDLMAFLIRSLRDARVLLAITYRSDELHRRHPLRPLLTAWERMRTVDRVELDRFDRGEVAAAAHRHPRRPPGAGAVADTVLTGRAETPTWWRSSQAWEQTATP